MDFFRKTKGLPARIFSLRDILVISLVFLLALRGGNFLVRSLRRSIVFDAPRYWPVSEFYPFPITAEKWIMAVACLGLFFFILKYLPAVTKKLSSIIGIGFLLALITNYFQGFIFGLVQPTMGLFPGTWQYYDQARKIIDPLYFFRNFEKLQLGLYQHSITHPPGATLIYYWLDKLFRDPAAISLAIAVFAVAFTGVFLYKILAPAFGPELSRFAVFLFLLIPAIQIYYLACLEAIIAVFFLGALYYFLHPRPAVSVAGAVIFLFLASCLTFLFAFILPVFFGYQLLRKRSLLKPFLIVAGLFIIYSLIWVIFRYNYLNSFWIACSYENIGRATPIYHTIEYLATRLEGVSEITLFFGPFLGILFLRGLRIESLRGSGFRDLSVLGVFTLILMFLAGFFRTGETARICVFIYPYLLLPVAGYFKEAKIALQGKRQLLALVFAQSVIMQLIGSYYW